MKDTKLYAWLWVPTLYFAQGIPYFIVNQISVAMFTKLGVPNGEMALFTSLLYLPWVIKPIWGPLVDLIRTKRWWILVTQILMSALMILTIISIPHPDPAVITAQQTPIKMLYAVLVIFIVMAFASATHDIAADGFYMLGLDQGTQAAMIGWRSVFYRLSNVFCNSALVAIPGIVYSYTENHGGANMPLAWQAAMLVAAVIFCLATLWHCFVLPRPADDRPGADTDALAILKGFGKTFATYFTKPYIWLAIIFMLVYRLPEAFLLKMVTPFLLGARETGGLGLSMQTYSVVYGIIGVVFLLLGGILGGTYISRVGLKRSIWWMAASMTLPCLTFVYLSMWMPTNLWAISTAVAIEQFGYGFGFTAYMMYMMYISDGEFKTSHYALCTGFMALSMMIPGMFAGFLQEALGYQGFFWMVIACCLATVAVTFFVRRHVDEAYGRK
ncbi:MAG: MFS transporter [Paludibacteraceae bacterium]|nr:MFS transporter [Paludibacteraceae bacterium]